MSISLFRGDDSDFADLREISVTLNAPFDLSGWSAEFMLQGYMQRFAGISSGQFSLVFPGSKTANMDLGECYGTLKLIDSSHRAKTLVKTIPFEIVSTVVALTDDDLTFNVTIDESTITITFESSTVGAETLANKTETVRADGVADNTKYPTEKAVRDAVEDLRDNLSAPSDANFRIKDGNAFQIFNVTTGKFHSVWLQDDSAGNPVLKWAATGDV